MLNKCAASARVAVPRLTCQSHTRLTFAAWPLCNIRKFLPQVNGRIIPKRIHVRIEHVHPSRCKEEFLRRVKANDEFKHEAKVKGGACFIWFSSPAAAAAAAVHPLSVMIPGGAGALKSR